MTKLSFQDVSNLKPIIGVCVTTAMLIVFIIIINSNQSGADDADADDADVMVTMVLMQ